MEQNGLKDVFFACLYPVIYPFLNPAQNSE